MPWHTYALLWVGVSGHGVSCSQGGTCVLVGDDAKRIAEAEELAKREIGCRVLRTSTYFQPEGHVQVGCSRRACSGCSWVCWPL